MADEIQELLNDLGSDDQETLESAIHDAGYLLEKSRIERGFRVFAEQRRVAEANGQEVPDDGIKYHESIQEVQRQFADLLPDSLVEKDLTSAEMDAIVARLIVLLQGPTAIAALAAGAFVYTDRTVAVPELTRALRRLAPVDGLAAHQAVVAMETILTRAVDPKRPLLPDLKEVVNDALDALALTASNGIEDIYEVRTVADRAIRTISRRFDMPISGKTP